MPRKGLAEKRERILKAAMEVFAEKGVGNATVEEIAVRAGVGKGTVYRRAGKKEDMINLLIEAAAHLVAGSIKKEIAKKKDPLMQFKEIVSALCDIYEEHSDLTILILDRATYCAGGSEIDRKKSRNAMKEVAQLFQMTEDVIRRAIRKKEIRPVDTHAVMKGLFHFLDPFYYRYLRLKRDYTKGEIAQLTIDLFLNGLKTKK